MLYQGILDGEQPPTGLVLVLASHSGDPGGVDGGLPLAQDLSLLLDQNPLSCQHPPASSPQQVQPALPTEHPEEDGQVLDDLAAYGDPRLGLFSGLAELDGGVELVAALHLLAARWCPAATLPSAPRSSKSSTFFFFFCCPRSLSDTSNSGRASQTIHPFPPRCSIDLKHVLNVNNLATTSPRPGTPPSSSVQPFQFSRRLPTITWTFQLTQQTGATKVEILIFGISMTCTFFPTELK